jgi:hypothetical protein
MILWLHSHDGNATIVLDRHNLIYTYGPLDGFERALIGAGVQRGELPQVRLILMSTVTTQDGTIQSVRFCGHCTGE